MARAGTPAERNQAARECGYKPYSEWDFQRRPIAQDTDFEEISWPRALKWWQLHPLLFTTDAARRERVFAWSKAGGTAGSPGGEVMVAVYYETPAASTDDTDLYGVVSAGGVVVEHYSPGAASQLPDPTDSRAVRVRGAAGKLGSIADLRLIVWTRSDDVKMGLWTPRSIFTDDQAVDLANALGERR